MTIASLSHSASRFGSPSLSVAFAPVQAFLALFTPPQRAPVVFRPTSPCPGQRLPGARHTSSANISSANISSLNTTRRAPALTGTAGSAQPVSRLKIVREFEPGMARSQAGRMVISGRMSDVCAELDRIAQSETARLHGQQVVGKSALTGS